MLHFYIFVKFLSNYCHYYFNPKPRCARDFGVIVSV